MAEVAAAMPPATARMVKQAINATAGALNTATSFGDADQSQLTAAYSAAAASRRSFRDKR